MAEMIAKFRLYWSLTKSLQTGLLLATGLAGYMTARCPVMHWYDFLGLAVSLFLAIAGSTIINMWYDRDIDAVMNRTHHRPMADGRVAPAEALRLGLVFSVLGVGMAIAMSPLYGLIVFAGLFFDVVIYTLWLKRRTCWSIIWGGIAGGMPILAGRAFGTGSIDGIGILLDPGSIVLDPHPHPDLFHALLRRLSGWQRYQPSHPPMVFTPLASRSQSRVSSRLPASQRPAS